MTTSISLLVLIGGRADGLKILLRVENIGGETTEAQGDREHGLAPHRAFTES